MTNIRPFREEPTWLNKAGAMLVYLVFGWIVTTQPPQGLGNLLSIFMVLGILVWAFIIRKRSVKYFVRFHVTQALLLNISLAAAFWLLVALIGLLSTLPGINLLAGIIVNAVFSPLPIVGGALNASIKDMVIMAMALILGLYTLKGEYTELPYITDGVRNWV